MSRPPQGTASIRRLARLLRPYRARMALTVGLLVLLAGVNMLIPMFIKLLLDDVFINSNWRLLLLILAGILAVYLARNLLYFCSKVTAVSMGEHLCFTVRNRLFDHLQRMNLQFYKRNRPGQISSRLMDDTLVIQTFIQDELPKLMQASFLFLGLLVVLYTLNWPLALAATFVLPLHIQTFRYFKRPIKESSRAAQHQMSIVQGSLIEKFLGMEVVKGCNAEQREGAAFEQANDVSRRSQMRSKTFHVTQKIVADLIVGLGMIGLLGFGAYHVIEHRMELGTFVAFFAYVGMLYPTVLELMSGGAKLTRTGACTDRVFEMLGKDDTESSSRFASKHKPIRGHLRFDRVSFGYKHGPPVLKDIDLEVQQGQVCAIVGPSGGGKSTLARLVPRFLEPDQGRILVDGMDLSKVQTQHLRSAIGIAFQDTFLFNSSVMENLRYACPDAPESRIMDVAERSGVHELIMKLPRGYDTVIGEDGVNLSRGETQRIAIARAMLKNPRILILDEATASIDAAAETQIIRRIIEFMKGRTTLLITHRAEVLRHADRVVKIEDGSVVYQGAAKGLGAEFMSFKPSPSRRIQKRILDRRRPDRSLRRVGVLCLLATTIGLGASAPRAAHGQEESPPPPPPPPAAEAEATTPPTPAADTPAPPVKAVEPASTPAAFGTFAPQPGLTATEVQELFEVIANRAAAELGYHAAGAATAARLPAVPDGVRIHEVLERRDGGTVHLIQLGFRPYKTQPLHLWLYGMTLTDDRTPATNGDLITIEGFVADARKARDDNIGTITVGDLDQRKIDLSYIEPDRCLNMLKTFGYTVLEAGVPIDPEHLPTIVSIPATANLNQVVGSGDKDNFPLTGTDPIHTLVVFYHPGRPEQFSTVLDKVRTLIDVPARQVVIEVMVLEISETGLEHLGVEWEVESPSGNLSSLVVGRLPAFAILSGERPTVDATFRNIFGEFSAKIQALIRKGDAEVLSRPSVTILDNRMAYIKVEERIPVVTSIANPNAATVTVNFKEVTAGIALGVRPRVSADEREISMQVAASVTSRVPNADVIVRTSDGREAARAPTISVRLVKTQTRVPNNTPFIIGGLVAKDVTHDNDKVPLLGDIPVIGPLLFTSTRVSKLKREVIIVVTPRLLPENDVVSAALPEDKEAFDSFDQHLFRDAYRIRAEDVFDLGFILQNRQVLQMQRLAATVVRHNVDLQGTYPFDRFSNGHVPGERILVFRQIYEVIKRRQMEAGIDPHQILFFRPDPSSEAGFSADFLSRHLTKMLEIRGKKADYRRIFKRLERDGKAVAMTYTIQAYSIDPSDILAQPVPKVQIVDCPDEATWSSLLWQMNQPDRHGNRRFTILLNRDKDLTRLSRAIVLKRTVQLNAKRQEMTLSNFHIGRLLLMPTLKEEKVFLIDEQTARYFFYTEQYYPAVKMELSRDLEAMRAALKLPEIQRYLPKKGERPGVVQWQPE